VFKWIKTSTLKAWRPGLVGFAVVNLVIAAVALSSRQPQLTPWALGAAAVSAIYCVLYHIEIVRRERAASK